MNKKLLLLVLLSLTSQLIYGSFAWSPVANLPVNRAAGSGFSIGNKGYISSGVNGIGNPAYQDLWEYDPILNTWTQKANCPGPARYSSVGFELGNLGYITTGWTWPGTIQLKDMWAYNPSTNLWVQKTDFPGAARYTATAFVINGYAYVGLGFTPHHNDFYKYDPILNSWTQIASLPAAARQSSSSFTINNLGYVIGGHDGFNTLSQLWEYNPLTNLWTQRASLPVATYAGRGFSICDKGYFGSGINNSGIFLNTFYEFDPSLNTWSQISSLPSAPRSNVFQFNIADSVYIIAGAIGNNFLAANTSWKFAHTAPNYTYLHQVCSNNFQFNASAGNNFYWNFGDGDTSNLQNPFHSYTDTGTYNVSLIITQSCFVDTTIKQISVVNQGIQASFNYTIDTCAKLVSFLNQGPNNIGYHWDFGDGHTSNSHSPIHQYPDTGQFTITLIAYSVCNDTNIQQVKITTLIPNAEFGFAIDTCLNKVTFINQSLNYSSSNWSFGDGTFSTAISPTHTYPSSGNYNITLIVINDCDTDSNAQQINIPFSNPTPADFSYVFDSCSQNILFTNQSSNILSCNWYFGDGINSTAINPVHTYSSTGNYQITLIINPNTSCLDSSVQQITIDEQLPIKLFIPNAFSPNNDQRNDVFSISGSIKCLPSQIKIFNRWGQLVYFSSDITQSWDGTFGSAVSPEGIYYYLIVGENGYVRNGSLSLFR